MVFNLDPEDRADIAEVGGTAHMGSIPIKLTVEQVKAMAYAQQSDDASMDLGPLGFAPMGDAIADELIPNEDRTLVISSYDDKGWIVVGYAWNTEGGGTWLAPDGGWHYQPGETGYYPWKD